MGTPNHLGVETTMFLGLLLQAQGRRSWSVQWTRFLPESDPICCRDAVFAAILRSGCNQRMNMSAGVLPPVLIRNLHRREVCNDTALQARVLQQLLHPSDRSQSRT